MNAVLVMKDYGVAITTMLAVCHFRVSINDNLIRKAFAWICHGGCAGYNDYNRFCELLGAPRGLGFLASRRIRVNHVEKNAVSPSHV